MELSSEEVHVWRATLIHPGFYSRFYRILSPDERERAERYHADLHRRRFVASRAIQRDVLSRYLGIPDSELRFNYSAHGKPSVVENAEISGLSFNVSNSGEMVVCAVWRGAAIGVDIEEVRPLHNAAAIASRFFTPRDAEAVRGARGDRQARLFLECWVRTEAQIKALGETVWSRLANPEVNIDFASARSSAEPMDGRVEPPWETEDLELGSDYVGALVVCSPGRQPLRYLDWEEQLGDGG